MTDIFWVSVLRSGEVIFAALLTFVMGCLTAAVMRRLFGPERVRNFFQGTGVWPLLRAWVLGMLLPVCSFGAIPVMRELRRAGVSSGTVLAFGLTAPLFNPVSLLFGLTLASSTVILVFSLCSLFVVTLIGLLANLWIRPIETSLPDDTPIPYGWQRMVSICVDTCREICGPSLAYCAAGVSGVVGLSLLLPNGCLQGAVEPDLVLAPLIILGVSLPVFLSPIGAMVQIAGMFEHGNSMGAAFVLLVVGAGMHLGTVIWAVMNYGWQRSAIFLGTMFLVVLGLAYAVDRPLYPAGVVSAGHTHAFDQYCYPVHEGQTLDFPYVRLQLKQFTDQASILFGINLVVVMGLAGILWNWGNREGRWQAWLERSRGDLASYDRILSPQTLLVVLVIGLIASGVISCYVYYPPPPFVFEELTQVRIPLGSAAVSQNWDEAMHYVPIAEDWIHKLPVGAVLRGIPRTDYRQAKMEVALEDLERLEHALESKNALESRKLAFELQESFRRLKSAWE